MTKKQGFRIFLSPPHMGGSEEQYLVDAFRSNWIAPTGPYLARFESKVSEYVGRGHTVAVSSGTAALHLALKLSGVTRGDVVLCPSLTFIASAAPVAQMGGIPVFIDCAKNSVNISAEEIKEAISFLAKKGVKPKAIIVVHLYGFPAPMSEILDVCREHGISVIEDAAESLGSRYRGEKTGSFGDFGVFSFNGNKIITTSGGGMLWTADPGLAERARYFSTQAREPVLHYEHKELGYNYRLSNLLAAVGVGQMECLDKHMQRRREINQLYRRALSSTSGLWFPEEDDGATSNMWLTTVFLPKSRSMSHRDQIICALAETGIEARPVWKPLHLQPVFKNALYVGSSTCVERFETGICLPSGSMLSDDQIEEVAEVFLKAFNAPLTTRRL